jgi:hypothetical protein
LEELRKENPQLKSKLYDALSGVVNDTSGNSDDKLLRIAKRYQAMDTPKRRLLGDPLANDPVLIAAAHEFAKWKERVGVDYQGPASAIMLIQTLDSADELYDDANEKKESASKLLENSHDENADAEKPKPFRSPASH